MIDPFAALMDAANDPLWRDNVLGQTEEAAMPGTQRLNAAVYLACFNTPAGRAVLADLYNQYVNVSRFVPGEPDGSGYYREGMAQVVFDIAARVEAASQGDENNGETAEG